MLHSTTLTLVFLLLHVNGAHSASSGANITDHLALLAIKSQITEDPQNVMSSWNSSLHFCLWQGVTCSPGHGRVTVLNLESKGLVGSLSPSVGNLSFLEQIQLQNNSFHGEIPPEVGRLFRIKELHLRNNFFEGEIPANLSYCYNLRRMDLGYNRLVGKLPNELVSLSMLKSLNVDYNNLTGGIPSFVGNLTSLEVFWTEGSPLGGSIPDVFYKLEKLQILDLSGNNISGTIPSSIFNLSSLIRLSVYQNQLHGSLATNSDFMLTNLQVLAIGENMFSGNLPLIISNFTKLRILDASATNFTGKIAVNFGHLQNLRLLYLGGGRLGSGEHNEMRFIDSLANCSKLEELELSENQFGGVLPDSLGNLSTKLDYLALNGNQLSGSIPSSIGNLFNLTLLGLSENHFTGTIPDSIGNLRKLQSLDLNVNNLSGHIPESLGNLSLLLRVDMRINRLEGTLPSSFGNWKNLNSLLLSQNNLNGSIPRELFTLSSLSIALDLSGNHFSGPIPVEVGNLKNLGVLSLGGNNLSGELPSSLGSCSSLEQLNLGSNFFQGSIPSTLSSLRALQELDLSNNNFSGQIPEFLEKLPLKSLNISNNSFEGQVLVIGVFANSSAISVSGNDRLCGGIPELQLPKCRANDSKGNRKLSPAIIVVISTVSTLFCVAMVSFLLYFWCSRKRKSAPSEPSLQESFLRVSYGMLQKATEGFSSANLIGSGSYSSVYKGILDEDGTVVAIKVLNLQNQGGSRSFTAECEALRNIRHRNLVKVITSCSTTDFQGNDFKAIVFEYMSNGSLERWLHSSVESQKAQEKHHGLDLLQRISISIDVASALHYLHQQCGKTIVHCDLKPSNILLDGDMVARVGDFGLAKFIIPELSDAMQSSSIGIRGTLGYTAPEYGLGCEVSTSGDVYSYGILILELVTGKKPTDPMFQGDLNLHNYADTALGKNVLEIVDPLLLNDPSDKDVISENYPGDKDVISESENYPSDKDVISENDGKKSQAKSSKRLKEECLISLVKIGVACSAESPKDRMNTESIINELHSIRSTILDASYIT